MTKQIWINLPVKDIEKSKAFFTALGFSFDSEYGNTETSASLIIGEKNVVVMLFTEEVFKGFTQTTLADTSKGSEVLFSIDAESKQEVDEFLKKVKFAGGTIFGDPQDQGWMYGFGFADLDGHRWNMLYMDITKMPKG